MYLNESGHVVIEDQYVCEFMSKNGSVEFMNSCESVLKSMCIAFSHQKTYDVDEFMTRLDPWGKKILESISRTKIDMSDLNRVLLDQTQTLSQMKDNGPVIRALESKFDIFGNKIDTLKEKMDLAKVIDTGLKRNDEAVVQNLYHIQKTIETINTRVEQLNTARNTTRSKGEEGEAGIIQILECKLPLRDGYEVFETKSKPHNCDAVVKRIGFPDVRVEIKAHGRDTGECVRTSEVKRFETDLIGLKDHGLFVSLYSGIVGKAPVEIDLLPTNKFAVYISNNNYDGDMLKEFINLIYKLDRFVSGDEGVKISTEAMTRIKSHIIDFNNKITSLKTNMKTSIDILNSITLDIIEKMLSTGVDMKPSPILDKKYTCEICNKDFSRPSALTNHIKTCRQKNAS
jgi:Zinc finger, C2H2 type